MSLQDIFGLSGFDNAPKRHPLWAIIGRQTEKPTTAGPLSATSHLPTSSKDKTATSLRLLLCEAQSSLENFSTQFQGLAKDVGRATFQIEETLKVVEDRQETTVGDLKSLRMRLLLAGKCTCLRYAESQLSFAKPSNSHEIP